MLYQVLRFLGQDPPPSLADSNLDDFWRWAVTHWNVGRVPRVTGVVVETSSGGSV
jgi:glutamyl-Q tRNA(Asp) synthetase